MFRLKTLPFPLSCLLALMLATTSSYSEDSTGIRLGNTDFGGSSSQRLGTSKSQLSQPNQARSFNNNASDPHVYEHRSQAPSRSLGQNSRHNKQGHHDSRQSYGNNADDPHFYQYRDQNIDHQGHDHNKQHYNHHYHPSYGIKGHRSFGLSPQRNHRKKSYDYNHRPYRDYRHDDHYQPNNYSHKRQGGLYFYSAPIGYSGYETRTNVNTIIRYPDNNNRPDESSGFTQADAWDALGNYEIDTARYAFESLVKHQPNTALPRVGFALSTALSGELKTGAYMMEQALLSDVSDLHYFSADQDLQLVIEELLLSYKDDDLMTSSLYYLLQDYRTANQAVSIAANQCQQCTAVINLQTLINQHI